MLVLSRKLGEKIVIGEGDNQVVITVVDIDRGKIRLGVQAARNISVLRAELLEGKRGQSDGRSKQTDQEGQRQ